MLLGKPTAVAALVPEFGELEVLSIRVYAAFNSSKRLELKICV